MRKCCSPRLICSELRITVVVPLTVSTSIKRGTLTDTYDRVQRLIAERRAGQLSLRQFEKRINKFSNEELACLAAALLETNEAERKRLERDLLRSVGEQQPSLAPL